MIVSGADCINQKKDATRFATRREPLSARREIPVERFLFLRFQMNDKAEDSLKFPEPSQPPPITIQPISIPIEPKPIDTSLGASLSPVLTSPFFESAIDSEFPDPGTISRNSSGMIDPEHVERLSSFVRHHRESVSLGRKRPSFASLTPQSAIPTVKVPSDGSIRAHSRNGSIGTQSIFETPSLKSNNGQSAISLLSTSPRPASYVKDKDPSSHGSNFATLDSKRVSGLGISSEIPAVTSEEASEIKTSPTIASNKHLSYTDKYDPQVFGQMIFMGNYDADHINLETTNLAALLGKKYVDVILIFNYQGCISYNRTARIHGRL